MKLMASASAFITAVCLVGCASSETRLLSPLGPRPGTKMSAGSLGGLQVFTAHEKVDSDVNFEEFFSDEGNLGQFDEPAHSDYTLYSTEDKVLRRVQNARDSQDPDPALLQLAPGRYEIEAESEGSDGLRTAVIVPVVIEAGQTTRVHLQAPWRPGDSIAQGEIVYMPHGQAVGWRALPSQNSIH